MNDADVAAVPPTDEPFIAPEKVEAPVDSELELYIRWYQLNTFLPLMHFLRPPAHYPDEIVSDFF